VATVIAPVPVLPRLELMPSMLILVPDAPPAIIVTAPLVPVPRPLAIT